MPSQHALCVNTKREKILPEGVKSKKLKKKKKNVPIRVRKTKSFHVMLYT